MKNRKGLVIALSCLIVVCLCVSIFAYIKNTNTIHREEIRYMQTNENLVSQVKESKELSKTVDSSAVCVLVSTELFSKKTVKRDGIYYSLVEVIDSSQEDMPQFITVAHKAKQLKKDGTFILFLNPVHQCSEDCWINQKNEYQYTLAFDEHTVYYLSGGEAGAIEVVEEADGAGRLTAYNEATQKEVEKLIGKTTEDFYAWFEQKYTAPESSETEITVPIPETTLAP